MQWCIWGRPTKSQGETAYWRSGDIESHGEIVYRHLQNTESKGEVVLVS